jgi:hypothetical protein
MTECNSRKGRSNQIEISENTKTRTQRKRFRKKQQLLSVYENPSAVYVLIIHGQDVHTLQCMNAWILSSFNFNDALFLYN